MTPTEALPIARNLAAAVCELDGCSAEFCAYMRDGSYDDHREVQAAVAGMVNGHRLASRKAKLAVVPDAQVAA